MSRLQDSIRASSPAGSTVSLDIAVAPGSAVVPEAAAALAGGGVRLSDVATGSSARVLAVAADLPEAAGGAGADLGRRLAELGFLPGEQLRVVARGLFGREPIAVRIGTGTFALRFYEAECIRVSLQPG